MLNVKYVIVPKDQELVFISNKDACQKIAALPNKISDIFAVGKKWFNSEEPLTDKQIDSLLNIILIKCLYEATIIHGEVHSKAVVGHDDPDYYRSTEYSITVIPDHYEAYLQKPTNLVRAG